MKKELSHKIYLKDLGIWLKIAVISWLAYLGLSIIAVIITSIYPQSGSI